MGVYDIIACPHIFDSFTSAYNLAWNCFTTILDTPNAPQDLHICFTGSSRILSDLRTHLHLGILHIRPSYRLQVSCISYLNPPLEVHLLPEL